MKTHRIRLSTWIALVISIFITSPAYVFAQSQSSSNKTSQARCQPSSQKEVDPWTQEFIDFITQNSSKSDEFKMKLADFLKVIRESKEHFFVDKSYAELIDMAMKGMVNKLDPWSRVLTDNEAQEHLNPYFDPSKNSGIGVTFYRDGGRLYIEDVQEGFPAQEAGIRPGDMILKINGADISDFSFDLINRRFLGQEGTQVYVEIGGARFEKPEIYILTRRELQSNNVVYKDIDENTAYVKIRRIEEPERTDADFERVLRRSQGKNLILDLRNNGGGLVMTAIQMVSHLVEGSKPIYYASNQNNIFVPNKTIGYSHIYHFPKKIIILTNEYTASASEMIAGSLQYYGIAEIIGTKTFGKARIQSQLDLDTVNHEPSEATRLLLYITISRYNLPGGEDGQGNEPGVDISGKGITPDIVVEQSDDFRLYERLTEKDAQFHAALEYLGSN